MFSRSPERSGVFDPFFTTKGSAGTGIGLWVTRGLVEKYGGYIRFRSAPRYGTCFAVLLPTTLAP
jgi:signal transduction histidine kinase